MRSDRNPADEELKAAWLAENKPKVGPTLHCMGLEGTLSEELTSLARGHFLTSLAGSSSAANRFEKAQMESKKLRVRLKRKKCW